MKLRTQHKKLVSVLILVLIVPLGLLVLFSFLFQSFSGEGSDSSESFSLLFVAALFCFPLVYAIRLWKAASAEKRIGDTSVDSGMAITISVRIDLKEYRKLLFILSYSKLIFLYIHFIAFGVIVFSVLQSRMDYWTWFFILFLAYLPFAIYRSANSNYAATKAIHENVEYEFTPEHISVRGQTFTSTQQWNTLYRVKEMENWFLLYTNKQNAMMIPKKSFATTTELDQFRNIAMKSVNLAS